MLTDLCVKRADLIPLSDIQKGFFSLSKLMFSFVCVADRTILTECKLCSCNCAEKIGL